MLLLLFGAAALTPRLSLCAAGVVITSLNVVQKADLELGHMGVTTHDLLDLMRADTISEADILASGVCCCCCCCEWPRRPPVCPVCALALPCAFVHLLLHYLHAWVRGVVVSCGFTVCFVSLLCAAFVRCSVVLLWLGEARWRSHASASCTAEAAPAVLPLTSLLTPVVFLCAALCCQRAWTWTCTPTLSL